MAFPSTSILDDFNRADENPLSFAGRWAKSVSTDNDLKIVSNVITHATGTGNGASFYWTPAIFTSLEVYATLATRPVGTNFGIDYCLQSVGGSFTLDGYRFQTNGTVLQLYRINNQAFTKIGGDYAINIAAGDSLGVSYRDRFHSLYWKSSGGAWSLVSTIFENSFQTGYIGVFLESGTETVDNFGGGYPPTEADNQPLIIHGRGAA